MPETDIAKAFLKAAEIAQKLPTNLQEAGFNRAVEHLLGKAGPADTGAPKQTGNARVAQRARGEEGRRDITRLMDAINRTAHPGVGSTARVGDRALKVLHLANEQHGVDGLTAGEIASILSTKFRLPTKRNSVLKALERETDTVDVRGGAGASRVFHIMAPGEAYLERIASGGQPSKATKRRSASAGRKAVSKRGGRPDTEKDAPKSADAKQTGGRKASGRPGPKAVIGQLLQGGFFQSPRTIATIQEELQHRRGHNYSVQELAPALVRSIRDQSLTRERSETGQYEYREA